MSTPTPDYGEPWRDEIMGGIVGRTDDFMVLPYMDYEGLDWDSEKFRDRAIACVNALAGVQDPAAEVAELRATLKQSHEALKATHDCFPVWVGTPSTMSAHQKQIAALAAIAKLNLDK